MKNHSITFFITGFLFTVTMYFTFSCKEDSDHQLFYQDRVTSSSYYKNDSLKSAHAIQYLNDRINLVRSCYYHTEEDSLKTEMVYQDENTIEQVICFYFGTQWYEVEKILMQMEYGKIVRIEDRYFDGSYWDYYYKMEYSYTSGNLTEEVLYYHEFSSWTPEEKISYEYDGNKPVRAIYYDYDNEWVMKYKEEACYSGDKTDSINGFVYIDSSFYQDTRYEYLYTEDRLTNIQVYLFDDEWDYSGDVTFTYNSHGKLETEELNRPTFSERYEYTYEEGLGNFSQCLMPGGGLVTVKFYPAPVKSSPASFKRKSDGPDMFKKPIFDHQTSSKPK